MKRWFYVSTATCIANGQVCKVGDVRKYLQGKVYLEPLQADKFPMPDQSYGYSSRKWAERAMKHDADSSSDLEKMWIEGGHTIHWKYEYEVVEVECHN